MKISIKQVAAKPNEIKLIATVTDAANPDSIPVDWHRSEVKKFEPSPNTKLTTNGQEIVDTSVDGNKTYYYQAVVKDEKSAIVESNILTVVAPAEIIRAGTLRTRAAAVVGRSSTEFDRSFSSNQFSQTAIVGALTQQHSLNSITCLLVLGDDADPIPPGTAVKRASTASASDKYPLVEPCTADTDQVFGFVNYTVKEGLYGDGALISVSIKGNVQFHYASAAIIPGQLCQIDSVTGGIKPAEKGNTVVGWAFDGAEEFGSLFRMYVESPTYLKAP